MKVDCYLIAGDMAMRLGDAEGGKQRYMKFLELAPKDHPKRRHAAEALSTYFGAQGK